MNILSREGIFSLGILVILLSSNSILLSSGRFDRLKLDISVSERSFRFLHFSVLSLGMLILGKMDVLLSLRSKTPSSEKIENSRLDISSI